MHSIKGPTEVAALLYFSIGSKVKYSSDLNYERHKATDHLWFVNHQFRTHSLCKHIVVWNLMPFATIELDGR